MSVEAITLSCPVCGDDSQQAVNAIADYSLVASGANVCGSCAEIIANAYNKKHSGRWLTWADDYIKPKYKKNPIGGKLQRLVHEKYLYRCVTCSTHLDLTCDHIVPESKGGGTVFENLQTMCRSCNSKKGVA